MKYKTKTVMEVTYSDLDQAVADFLKSKEYKNYSFLKYGYDVTDMEELNNNSAYPFDVSPAVNESLIEAIKNNEGMHYRLKSILNLMCYEKVIEPGNYLILVSW